MKQLDCKLNCKATAQLEDDVAEDLCKKDKCLANLLKEDKDESQDKDSNRASD